MSNTARQKRDRQSEPETEKELHMALSKKRKVDIENSFQPRKDRLIVMFILPTGKTKTLIKSANVKRQYEPKHNVFHQTYPLKSELRSQKICLRAEYEQSTRILTHSFTAQQRANECSLRVTWILGQHKKPFTDGGVVKECMSAVAETLLDGKQKEELCDKINQIPMSASSATKNI